MPPVAANVALYAFPIAPLGSVVVVIVGAVALVTLTDELADLVVSAMLVAVTISVPGVGGA